MKDANMNSYAKSNDLEFTIYYYYLTQISKLCNVE